MNIGGNLNPAIENLLKQGSKGITQSSLKPEEAGSNFSSQLMDVLKEVNASQQNAASTQQAFMTGQPVDYHDLMIAMEKASVSMQLTMAVRNKILEAYQEINRMQV